MPHSIRTGFPRTPTQGNTATLKRRQGAYRSPEYLALKKAEKEGKASPRLVPTYFPRPSGDELEAQWMEWHGLEPPSSGYDRPPEVANADVGGVGEWELAGA